jgi:hypothetical protein
LQVLYDTLCQMFLDFFRLLKSSQIWY